MIQAKDDGRRITQLLVYTRHPQNYVLVNEKDGSRWRGNADGRWKAEPAGDPTDAEAWRNKLWELIHEWEIVHTARRERRKSGETMNADYLDAVLKAEEAIDEHILSPRPTFDGEPK